LTNSVKLPNPEEVIHKDDILIVVSHHGDVERLLGKEGS
jgi:hypothetical protein